MTETQFDTGYWYALELKEFAADLGIRSASSLRKDELERAIKFFLRTGQVTSPTSRSLSKPGVRDIDIGLSLKLPVVNYTSNRATKAFIEENAKRLDSNFKKKSGASYRLNRWREEQLSNNVQITYEDLIRHYVKLNQATGRFPQAPSGRFIKFVSDFLAKEKNATRERALAAWKKLKILPIPKNYRAWVKYKRL